MNRSLALVSVVACALACVTDAFAEEALPPVSANCERVVGPGRVRCEAEIVAPTGSLAWADVQIVETPSFVTALKGRVAPSEASLRDKGKWRFSFGLVARARGAGEVKLRLRAVVCPVEGSPAGCRAVTVPTSVAVISGA